MAECNFILDDSVVSLMKSSHVACRNNHASNSMPKRIVASTDLSPMDIILFQDDVCLTGQGHARNENVHSAMACSTSPLSCSCAKDHQKHCAMSSIYSKIGMLIVFHASNAFLLRASDAIRITFRSTDRSSLSIAGCSR
jgi:hypothetical protein